MTDSPYAKPNKATKSSQSPLPSEGTQTRIHITETHTTHHYQQQHGEPYPPQPATQTKQNQLDSMLGNLQADMSRQGVNTTQKGCCSACEKPIVGQVNEIESIRLSSVGRLKLKNVFLIAGDHCSGKNLASRTFHLHSLQSGTGDEKFLRKGGTPLLRTRLSQSFLSPLRLL